MYLWLTFQNIKTFAKTKPVLLLFIILSQVVCIVAAFSVAGLIDVVTPDPEDERSDGQKMFFVSFTPNRASEPIVPFFQVFDEKDKKFLYVGTDKNEVERIRSQFNQIAGPDQKEEDIHTIDINEGVRYVSIDNLHSFGEIREKLNEVIRTSMNDVLNYSITGYTDDTMNTSFEAEGGDSEWLRTYRSGIYGDDHKVIVTRNPYADTPYQTIQTGDRVTIGKTEYTAVEVKNRSSMPPNAQTSLSLMANAIDDSFKVDSFQMLLTDKAGAEEIARIQQKIAEVFGDEMPEVTPPQPKPLMEKQFNNMIYVLSFMIIVVVILNVSRLYTFIMSTRKKSLAVFSICGASRRTIFAIYIAEILLMLLISFVLGVLLFRFALMDTIAVIYPSFTRFFTPPVYLMIFGIYIVVGLVIMTANIIPVVRKSVTELKKG